MVKIADIIFHKRQKWILKKKEVSKLMNNNVCPKLRNQKDLSFYMSTTEKRALLTNKYCACILFNGSSKEL